MQSPVCSTGADAVRSCKMLQDERHEQSPRLPFLMMTRFRSGYFMLALILVTIAQLYGAFDADKMHQKDAKDA